MFERRAKIFLGLLIAITVLLMGRALQVQVFSASTRRDLADRTMQKDDLIPTRRGSILDYRGREIAGDQPCVDACVDYRAVKKEPAADWVHKLAVSRATSRGDEWKRATKDRRDQIIKEETKWVQDRIHAMWDMLTHESKKKPVEIDELR